MMENYPLLAMHVLPLLDEFEKTQLLDVLNDKSVRGLVDASSLACAFQWHSSKQGDVFWREISRRISE